MEYLLIVTVLTGPHAGEYVADYGLTREDCGKAIVEGIAGLYTGKETFTVDDSIVYTCKPQAIPAN